MALGKLESIKGNKVSNKSFDTLLSNSGSLFERAVKGKLVIPEFEQFANEIRRIFDDVIENRDGDVADYIPLLVHPGFAVFFQRRAIQHWFAA